MDVNILFLQGALSLPSFWQHQEDFFKSKYVIKYPGAQYLPGDSIIERAHFSSETADKDTVVVAFSLGGYVAVELAVLYPEKLKGLILINSSGQAISEKGKNENIKMIELISKGRFDFLVKSIFRNSFYDKSIYRENLDLLKEMSHSVGGENYVSQLQAIIDFECKLNKLKNINCPVLIIHSDQDLVMPKARSIELHRHLPHSQLVEVESCGHMLPLEKPHIVNSLIDDWIQGNFTDA